jgi:diacylglycerol kinase (ATP)
VTRSSVALVVNGRAGRGRVSRAIPRLVRLLDAGAVEAVVLETAGPGHATDLARRAAHDGAATVVAVGGDGTVNEVVNGLLDGNGSPIGARLGVVAAGSGCDFARTFGLPGNVDSGLQGIVGPTRPLDVGRIECAGPDGPMVRYFVNVAEAGMAAATVERAERLPRWLGRARYMVAFWPTLLRYRPTLLSVATPAGTHTGVAHNVIVANARFFGGGMRVSPGSDPADGVVDVQVNVGPKVQALTLIPKMFRGTHLPNRRIIELHGSRVTIDSDTPVLVEADGELVGTTPATITVLPGALQLVA